MNLKRQKEIFTRLKADYDYLSTKYEVLGVFVQGSDNYNLSDDKSDIDTKAIVIPGLKSFLESKRTSTTIILNNNAHLDVKDIQIMFECFLKQNINFIEILFTPYYILNPKYADLFKLLLVNKESLARYDKKKFYNTVLGDLKSKLKSMTHIAPHSELDISLYGYCLKDYHHIYRLDNFMTRYLSGIPYESCLNSYNTEEDRLNLIKLKREKVCSAEEAVENAKIIVNKWEICLTKMITEYPKDEDREDLKLNKWIKDLLDEIKYSCIEKKIYIECKNKMERENILDNLYP